MQGGSTKNTGFSALGISGFMTSGNSAQQEKVKSEIKQFSIFFCSTDQSLCKRKNQEYSNFFSQHGSIVMQVEIKKKNEKSAK